MSGTGIKDALQQNILSMFLYSFKKLSQMNIFLEQKIVSVSLVFHFGFIFNLRGGLDSTALLGER